MALLKNQLVDQLNGIVRLLEDAPDDFDALLQRIEDARVVMIGEASHGTHEFYRMRAQITRQLIRDKRFHAVVVEADWPEAYRVSRNVRGFTDDDTAADALGGFRRFPQWMWRNADVLDFIGWLREHNDGLEDRERVGFYGLDLYSLYGSIDAVVRYLEKVDPQAAKRARYRYGCFERFRDDPQAYGYAAGFDLGKNCEDEVVQQLLELRQRAAEYARRDGRIAEDEYFYAEQNARLVHNAEEYYRTMFRGRISSWNLRDQHMAETVQSLIKHLDRFARPSKVVVWAHNSHLGDARATEMGEAGELNVGQLLREQFGSNAFNIGFTTYSGTVTAASDWGGPAQIKHIRPALAGSYEHLFHEIGLPQFLLMMRGRNEMDLAPLRERRLERAIGVIYLPETERMSHYFHARLAEQFDAMIHIDQTRAVEPLESAAADMREPETYPSGV